MNYMRHDSIPLEDLGGVGPKLNFQNVAMLHIKVKGMTHAAIW